LRRPHNHYVSARRQPCSPATTMLSSWCSNVVPQGPPRFARPSPEKAGLGFGEPGERPIRSPATGSGGFYRCSRRSGSQLFPARLAGAQKFQFGATP
jgi:hypothetical protein